MTKYGYTTKQVDGNIFTNLVTLGNNATKVAVTNGQVSTFAEVIRKGDKGNMKKLAAKGFQAMVDKQNVERDATKNGWFKFDQADSEESATELNMACNGREWCTAGAVSTARHHRSGGDFHVYMEKGEPLIAIKTSKGSIDEIRGSKDGQGMTTREAEIAGSYVKDNSSLEGGDLYLADQEMIKQITEFLNTDNYTADDVVKLVEAGINPFNNVTRKFKGGVGYNESMDLPATTKALKAKLGEVDIVNDDYHMAETLTYDDSMSVKLS